MIVMTAATSWEAAPFVRGWRLKERGPGRFEGRLGSHPLCLLRTGIGPERTRLALAALEAASPLIALSSGLAGALQPGIRSGDLVADLRGAPAEAVASAREAALGLGLRLHFGALASSPRVLAEPAEKRSLGASARAAAVDMESETVRRWSESRGCGFVAVRAVLDELEETLPEWSAEDESPRGLALYALRNLGRLPSLARLGWRTRRAMAALQPFLDRWLPGFAAAAGALP